VGDAFAHLVASPLLLAAVFVIVSFAAIVQFGLGMGFGLTAAPLLALLDPALVPAPTLFIGLMTSTLGALRERDAIVWGEVASGSLGRVAGVVVATFLLAGLQDRTTFMLVFGIMVALAVVLSVVGWRLPFTRVSLVAMAVVSGLMGTITSVGAPPLAIVYQDRKASEARPTLAAFFAIGCAISLIGLFVSGWADSRDFVLALLMVPAMFAGFAASRFLKGRFDSRFRPALLAITGLAAVMLIFRGLT
jgi:uncharacterized membrane protein YfcA